jgi:pSer/pThr/pTyr-binding forkhead associated (FHA) protein
MPNLAGMSPDATAHSPTRASSEVDGEATVTFNRRRDGSAERVPGVVIRQGKEVGRTFEIRVEQVRIGRSRENDIFLEDLNVSRWHATIYRNEMGGYTLRDENSANGTMVNGQRVTSEQPLQEGDEIQMGMTILAFVRR